MIIGIDPGKSGGIAWEHEGEVKAIKMPETLAKKIEFFRIRSFEEPSICAVVEQVGSRPGQGSVSIWTFAEGIGELKGVLASLSIPMRRVSPQKWTAWLNIGSSRDYARPGDKAHKVKARWKKALQEEAQRRFPHIEVTLSTADALLILDWARKNS